MKASRIDNRRELTVPRRRFASPFGNQKALLEPIVQPLYSSFVLNNGAVPAQLAFFQYAVGENVPVNFGTFVPRATTTYTNMQIGGQLPTPKVFLVTGVRVVVAEIGRSTGGPQTLPTSSAAGTVAAPTFTGQDVADLDDLQKILWGSAFSFTVGEKNYLTVPTAFLPGNVGAAGAVNMLAAGGTTPVAAVTTQRVATFVSRGDYFSLTPYNILIASQQNFGCTIDFQQETAQRPQLNTSRQVYAVLDGILGREVQ